MAKGSAKKPKESKCRGSSAPLEGRDWVRIGRAKWLREVAEKTGKHIPKEYGARNGSDFEKDRAARQEEKEKAPMLAALDEARRETVTEDIPDADAPIEEEDAVYPGE